MTLQTQVDDNASITLCTSTEVEAYLKNHPEFFETNPQLLIDMELPHTSGRAISLIERQVSLLRQENKQLRGRIKELVEIAKQNEALIVRLHRLSISLIETQNVQQYVETLRNKLFEDFAAFGVSIKIYKNNFKICPETTNFIERHDPMLRNLEKFLNHTNPVCGRFTPEQLNYLFPDIAAEVKSMALVPLISDQPLGFFAIASNDSEHFKAGISTSFLSSLSEVAAAVLQRFR